jgi:glycerate 2-kinase
MKQDFFHPTIEMAKQDGTEVHESVQLAAFLSPPTDKLRILIAPSGFKESLGPEEVADCLEEGLRRVSDLSTAVVRKVPLHDGGEGFCKAVVSAHNGRIIERQVIGPVGQPVQSHFGIIRKDGTLTGVLDMAAAAGLRLVPVDARDPTKTTTYGVGELMAAALDEGCSRLIIGCGDSGTSDGGAGLLQALGVRFRDAAGFEIGNATGGEALHNVQSVDMESLHPSLKRGIGKS